METSTEQEQYLCALKNVLADTYETLTKKGADYAEEDNPFSCFERSADMAGVSVPQGMVVRIMDKVGRIVNLLKKPPAVVDESIVDTARDLIGYAAILAVYLQLTTLPEQWEQEQETDTPAKGTPLNWFRNLISR